MMTFKELKAKLLTCEKTLKCLQNGTYKDLSPEDIQAKQSQLNTIKEDILKKLEVLKEAVEFEDEKDAANLSKFHLGILTNLKVQIELLVFK